MFQFWTVCGCSSLEAHVTRRPLDHLMGFLMSRGTDDSAGKLPTLVFGKFDAILAEFESVLDAESETWHLWRDLMAGCEPTVADDQVALLVSSCLELFSELNRRLTPTVKGFPGKLAWLIFSPDPCEPCNHRRQLADELLSARTCDLDHCFTGKFRLFFAEELRACRETGSLCPQVHQLVSDFFNMLPMETQEVEGANSVIKRIHELAPNVKLPLMSDRLLIKKAVTARLLQGTQQERREAKMNVLHYAVDTHKHALQQPLGPTPVPSRVSKRFLLCEGSKPGRIFGSCFHQLEIASANMILSLTVF